MPRSDQSPDKVSAAISVLNRARASMLDQMADQILSMADEFAEGGFQANEFLETNGSRLHFLCLMIGQFELLREMRQAEESERRRASEKKSKRREDPAAGPSRRGAPPAPSEESGTDS